MTRRLEPMVRLPTTRAQCYPHAYEAEPEIVSLDTTHLTVDIGVSEDRVTLSASIDEQAQEPWGYGYEFDLEPTTARRLARQLASAADALEPDP